MSSAQTDPTTPAAAAYLSPMESRRPHLGHALASEWTKLVSVRSTLWTLGSLVVVVVGIGVVFIAQTTSRDYTNIPFTTPALIGMFVGQLAVMVLGVLTITSEHGTGLVRTTFTAAPDRHRVLTAKYLVFGLTAFLASAGSVFVVGTAAAIAHNGPAAGSHSAGEWAGALAGSFYVTLLGLLALAVGALVRHSAGAIAVMIGVVTLPPVAGAMLSIWEASAPLGRLVLQHNAPVALMQLFGMPSGTTPTGSPQAMPDDLTQMALMLLVTGAAMAASFVVVGRRDV
ncbi:MULTISPECIES: ABC transporter permease [unclassified Streptomyces]|uniref:ABC transporter permease n=1 Tax=unclassified Streptomyces TaxID=2593676 RepID=UPI002E30B990|nr:MULTISPECIES: ABC transporter permease [unclassified Streptomyces]WUC64609.1 ABC transporter permease [Streptomyces sp. NBC_00539]